MCAFCPCPPAAAVAAARLSCSVSALPQLVRELTILFPIRRVRPKADSLGACVGTATAALNPNTPAPLRTSLIRIVASSFWVLSGMLTPCPKTLQNATRCLPGSFENPPVNGPPLPCPSWRGQGTRLAIRFRTGALTCCLGPIPSPFCPMACSVGARIVCITSPKCLALLVPTFAAQVLWCRQRHDKTDITHDSGHD